MDSIYNAMFPGISKQRFVEAMFDREVLKLTSLGIEPDKLCSVETFYRILPRCENVRAVFDGMNQASIAPNDARQMFAAGATICGTGLEHACARLGSVSESLRKELGFTGDITVRGYHSPAGKGFGQHWDTRIVTTVQIEGSKRWFYGNRPATQRPLQCSPIPLSAQYKDHLEKVGVSEAFLLPGDVLFLPSGTIHWAEAGAPSFALNIAFEYIHKSIADYLCARLKRELLRHASARSALFLPLSDTSNEQVNEVLRIAVGQLEAWSNAPSTIYKDRGETSCTS